MALREREASQKQAAPTSVCPSGNSPAREAPAPPAPTLLGEEQGSGAGRELPPPKQGAPGEAFLSRRCPGDQNRITLLWGKRLSVTGCLCLGLGSGCLEEQSGLEHRFPNSQQPAKPPGAQGELA